MKYFSRSNNWNKNLRPPDLYEFFVDNYWFNAANLENQKINEPLRGNHNADVVIVGGGFTGLSAAFHIGRDSPKNRLFCWKVPVVAMVPVGETGGSALRQAY